MTQQKQVKKYSLNRQRDGYKSLDLQNLKQKFPSLEPISGSAFRSDRTKELHKLREKGYEALAWKPNIKYLFYNPEKDVLVKDVEGDLYVIKNPSDDLIEKEVQKFPKMEVAIGENYDSRFD